MNNRTIWIVFWPSVLVHLARFARASKLKHFGGIFAQCANDYFCRILGHNRCIIISQDLHIISVRRTASGRLAGGSACRPRPREFLLRCSHWFLKEAKRWISLLLLACTHHIGEKKRVFLAFAWWLIYMLHSSSHFRVAMLSKNEAKIF